MNIQHRQQLLKKHMIDLFMFCSLFAASPVWVLRQLVIACSRLGNVERLLCCIRPVTVRAKVLSRRCSVSAVCHYSGKSLLFLTVIYSPRSARFSQGNSSMSTWRKHWHIPCVHVCIWRLKATAV